MTYVVVASCMALQLAGTVHLAVVQHAICAEHGEAMDVGEEHASAPAADSRETRIAGANETTPTGEEHHHCPFDEDRNTHGLVVLAALVGPRIAVPVALPPPHAEPTQLAARALRLLAPKTSPPA